MGSNSRIVTASLLFSSLLIYLWNYSYWTRRRVRQRCQFPIFGDNFRHFFQLSPYHEVLSALYNRFSSARYMGFYQYCQPGLMIRDPDLIKEICIKSMDSFLDRKNFLPKSADVLWNKNIFALQGQKWKDMRNTLSPSFTGKKMRLIFGLVAEYSENFTKFLAKGNEDLIEVEFKDLFTRITTDVIATVAFGINIDSLREPHNEFYEKGKQAMQTTSFWKNFKLKMTLIFPVFGCIFGANIFDKTVSDFFRNLIKTAIDHRKKTNMVRPDMLHLLMKAHEPSTEEEAGTRRIELDNDDITSQALVFFLGGFETASNALCFMAYELALNPKIQDRLCDEIDEYYRECGLLTYDGLSKLNYLEMVVSETLRKWPPLLNMDRMCLRDYTIQPKKEGERPLKIKKSTLIWIPVWCIHRDPKYWPNPDLFDPDRFETSKKQFTNRAAFLPFGMGPRSCLGARFAVMEIKVIMYELLSRFKIVPLPHSEIPFVPLKHSFSLASANGFKFGLEKRQYNLGGTSSSNSQLSVEGY